MGASTRAGRRVFDRERLCICMPLHRTALAAALVTCFIQDLSLLMVMVENGMYNSLNATNLWAELQFNPWQGAACVQREIMTTPDDLPAGCASQAFRHIVHKQTASNKKQGEWVAHFRYICGAQPQLHTTKTVAAENQDSPA
jgi:hypothetical protein